MVSSPFGQSLVFDISNSFTNDGNTLSHLTKCDEDQKTNPVAETERDAVRSTEYEEKPAFTQ